MQTSQTRERDSTAVEDACSALRTVCGKKTTWKSSQEVESGDSNLLSIVVLDDNLEDIEIIRRHLEKIPDWEVDFYPFPLEVARIDVPSREPDLIFVDYNLGDQTGVDLIRRIRELGVYCPVILVTAFSGEEVAVEALRAGAADYLSKDNLSASSLKRAISNCLEKYKLQRRIEEHERDLERTNRDLVKKNEEIRSFYHTLSHELKTPLTSALEFLSILLDGLAGPLSEEQEQYLEIARSSCNQIWTHVNDLLDASRLETGKFSLNIVSTSIEAPLLRSLPSMVRRARDERIELSHEIEPNLPEVLIDENRIIHVLTNLLNNALKFTPEGGRVKIRAERDDCEPGFVRVSVEDTGRGIDEEQMDRIFERLVQVKESDAAEEGGLGIGLYLCREVIRMHGGRIWVESVPGQGSTFHFTVPQTASLEAKRILVVDDEPEIRDIFRKMLEKEGYLVETAAGGYEALEILGRGVPDLILMDLKMPGMDGPTLLRAVRQDWGDIPVAVITAYPESELMRQVLDHSPITVLQKPCLREQLLGTVRGLLARVV